MDEYNMDLFMDKLNDAVENGELTEAEARQECIDYQNEFWRSVNDRYWGR